MSRFRFALLGLLALAFAAGCSGAPTAAAWPGLAANGQLAFVAFNNKVVAVNLTDGKQRWAFPASPGSNSDMFFADPAVGADIVVVGSEGPLSSHSGALFGLNPADGAQKWCLVFDQKAAQRLNCPMTPTGTKSIFSLGGLLDLMPPVDNRILGGLTLQDGVVYFGMANNNVYAVDAATGAYKWEAQTKDPVWAPPLVAGDTVYVASLDHTLYALNRTNGQQLWAQNLGASLAGAPVLVNGTLYIGTFGKQLVALDANTGQKQWNTDTANWVWSSPAVQDGVVYFSDLSGNLVAVDAAGGAQRWTVTPGAVLRGTPALTADAVIIGDNAGKLFARRRDTGAEVWSQAVSGGGQLLGSPLVLPDADLVLVAPYSGSNWLVAYTTAGTLKWAFAPAQ